MENNNIDCLACPISMVCDMAIEYNSSYCRVARMAIKKVQTSHNNSLLVRSQGCSPTLPTATSTNKMLCSMFCGAIQLTQDKPAKERKIKMDAETIYAVVKKLVGRIDPEGDSGVDEKRLANLRTLKKVMDILISDIRFVARYKDSHEHSVREIGMSAQKFIDEMKED